MGDSNQILILHSFMPVYLLLLLPGIYSFDFLLNMFRSNTANSGKLDGDLSEAIDIFEAFKHSDVDYYRLSSTDYQYLSKLNGNMVPSKVSTSCFTSAFDALLSPAHKRGGLSHSSDDIPVKSNCKDLLNNVTLRKAISLSLLTCQLQSDNRLNDTFYLFKCVTNAHGSISELTGNTGLFSQLSQLSTEGIDRCIGTMNDNMYALYLSFAQHLNTFCLYYFKHFNTISLLQDASNIGLSSLNTFHRELYILSHLLHKSHSHFTNVNNSLTSIFTKFTSEFELVLSKIKKHHEESIDNTTLKLRTRTDNYTRDVTALNAKIDILLTEQQRVHYLLYNTSRSIKNSNTYLAKVNDLINTNTLEIQTAKDRQLYTVNMLYQINTNYSAMIAQLNNKSAHIEDRFFKFVSQYKEHYAVSSNLSSAMLLKYDELKQLILLVNKSITTSINSPYSGIGFNIIYTLLASTPLYLLSSMRLIPGYCAVSLMLYMTKYLSTLSKLCPVSIKITYTFVVKAIPQVFALILVICAYWCLLYLVNYACLQLRFVKFPYSATLLNQFVTTTGLSDTNRLRYFTLDSYKCGYMLFLMISYYVYKLYTKYRVNFTNLFSKTNSYLADLYINNAKSNMNDIIQPNTVLHRRPNTVPQEIMSSEYCVFKYKDLYLKYLEDRHQSIYNTMPSTVPSTIVPKYSA